MTFKIYRASEKTPDEGLDITPNRGYPSIYFDKDTDAWYVDVETMDDLKRLSDLYDEDVIVRRPLHSIRKNWEIWIYDDYME